MTKSLLMMLVCFFLSNSIMADCNVDQFYNGISSDSGYKLKSELSNLLSIKHKSLAYGELHQIYKSTDTDLYYDADGSILDMYSENPSSNDPYTYKPGRKRCGKKSRESSCYNREHLFPQGLFRKVRPMKTDIFHVFPTDKEVNRARGSYPFGETNNVTWKSQNGSKLGFNKGKQYTGLVFEPIDEFKGDIARAMLYFAVRYQDQIPGFKTSPMTDGSYDQTYSTWFLNTLIKWHKQDPVSEHEVHRNNAACLYQKNRNPFIDHPSWVSTIWEVQ